MLRGEAGGGFDSQLARILYWPRDGARESPWRGRQTVHRSLGRSEQKNLASTAANAARFARTYALPRHDLWYSEVNQGTGDPFNGACGKTAIDCRDALVRIGMIGMPL